MTCNFFDSNFRPLLFTRLYKRDEGIIEKPEKWDAMLEISRLLSKSFPFVRIDLYLNNDVIKLGEMTFYPGNGTEQFSPVEWDYEFGKLITLPYGK